MRCVGYKQKERVIKIRHQHHSLAKHLGLIGEACGCDSVLSESQWSRAKSECIQRKGHFGPCPICLEDFGLQSVVLLSCTHLLHKTCLRSFENFCNKYCCPVCRQNYHEKRVVFFTQDAFYQMAATRTLFKCPNLSGQEPRNTVKLTFVFKMSFEKTYYGVPPTEPQAEYKRPGVPIPIENYAQKCATKHLV
ncbi:hypothetical protein FGIG_09055 [Fasciola gigantica]|uniref:RING-type domain-containing protein n=1 Tax=Fasciola gigantica TaxID=46835 RepID=A0A504YM33_FASGI|nr:hypothetical protein FGIG_09055 [Fasciola gigantica]